MKLIDQLAALPSATLQRLHARGFDPARLVSWAQSIGKDRDRRNRLPGRVEPPHATDLLDAPRPGTAEHTRFEAAGIEALKNGDVAFCLLAGGMATRMGGVVKALADALPGRSFLDLRLSENAHLEALAGRRVPLWLMTSEATNTEIRNALGARHDAQHLTTFEQFVSLRLTPEGELFTDDEGAPSVYATGHGDLPDALRASGLLSRFLDGAGGRKKTVWIANIDNLGASLDPAILGQHLHHNLQQDAPITVELVDKVGGDRGGGPVRHDGRPIITEEFRLPVGFDATTVPVFNTNTFLVDATALAGLSMEWSYVEVEKQIGDAKAIQFERLLGEITAALDARMLRVPREGLASRFLPVKDFDELERRSADIEAIALTRGMMRR